MRQSGSTVRLGRLALFVAASTLALSACGKKTEDTSTQTETTATVDNTAAAANTTVAEANAAAPAAGAPAADNTDTLTGVKYASYAGDAAKGKIAFLQCQTCHSGDAGVNKIGPSLHGVVGRKASSVPGYSYSAANHASRITWTEEKLFQYLEKPQRVVPGTKMSFAGFSDPQKRADVIAYLKTLS